MHADLMRAPGLQVHLEQGGVREGLERVVVRHAGLAAGDHCPLVVVLRMAVDRRVDRPAQRIAVPLDDGVVRLVDRALLELALQARVGGLALGHRHHPGGADVETVDHALPLRRPGGADAVARRLEAADHGRTGPAGTGVGSHADGLVDDHDVVVVEEHAHAGHRLRRQGRFHGGLAQVDAEQGAGQQPIGLGAGPAVDQDGPVGDEVDGTRPGEPEQPGEGDVESLAGEPVGDRQQALGHEAPSRARRRSVTRVARRRSRRRAGRGPP